MRGNPAAPGQRAAPQSAERQEARPDLARLIPSLGLVIVLWGCADESVSPREQVSETGQVSPGQRIYQKSCAPCHDGTIAARAPGYENINGMTPRAIVAALEQGRMREHGQNLTEDERRSVAEWLTGRSLVETSLPETAYCREDAVASFSQPSIFWSGWGGDLKGSGYRSTSAAGLERKDVPSLRLRWAFGFPEAVQTRSQPALLGRNLIVGSQFGELFSLDYETGCVRWMFQADAAIRGAISVGEGPDGTKSAFFSDFRTNVYAVEVANGRLLWRQRAGRHHDSSNTGSLVLSGGHLYVPISSMEVATSMNPAYRCCTSSGAVAALDAKTGAVLWYHRVISQPAVEAGANALGTPIFAPSGAPVWSSPTVDEGRGLLYLGTGQNYTRPTTDTSDAILALDLRTGTRRWHFQATTDDAYNLACVAETQKENCSDPMGPDVDFGMAPILTRRADGKEVLVVGQKAGVVFSLDPDRDGAVLWSRRIGRGGLLGGIHWGMATDGRRVYVANADNPIGFVPEIEAEVEEAPGVYALDLNDGEVIWQHPSPGDTCTDLPGCIAGQSAAPTLIPGVVFAGGLDGHLRAYSTDDGSLLWDFNTVREFESVNGVVTRGGAIDGPGPVIARGMVFAHSGYGMFEQMPGNALLAFAAEEP